MRNLKIPSPFYSNFIHGPRSLCICCHRTNEWWKQKTTQRGRRKKQWGSNCGPNGSGQLQWPIENGQRKRQVREINSSLIIFPYKIINFSRIAVTMLIIRCWMKRTQGDCDVCDLWFVDWWWFGRRAEQTTKAILFAFNFFVFTLELYSLRRIASFVLHFWWDAVVGVQFSPCHWLNKGKSCVEIGGRTKGRGRRFAVLHNGMRCSSFSSVDLRPFPIRWLLLHGLRIL